MKKNFRKRNSPADDNDNDDSEKPGVEDDDEQERRLALEEVKFLQKQRQKKSGVPALPINGGVHTLATAKNSDNKKSKTAAGSNSPGGGGDGDEDDMVLQENFAQETQAAEEDPNLVDYINRHIAKKKGKTIDPTEQQIHNELQRAEDDLYKIPDHLKVKRRNSEESSTQWTTGIAEVQLPIEFKLRNIEETEAAKKFLQEKRLVGQTKSDISIPSSYSADYFQRGRDYAEKLRREHPELYKDRSLQDNVSIPRQNDTSTDAAGQRQAATDEFMLDRFRKRERHRGMRR